MLHLRLRRKSQFQRNGIDLLKTLLYYFFLFLSTARAHRSTRLRPHRIPPGLIPRPVPPTLPLAPTIPRRAPPTPPLPRNTPRRPLRIAQPPPVIAQGRQHTKSPSRSRGRRRKKVGSR